MKIRERIRGKKKYYYLEESIRKEKKVIKKERYLGTEIPENIEKIKKIFLKEIKSDLLGKLKKIKQNFQKEWQRIPETVKEKEKEEIAISFTYNTNAIEGSTITLEEAREIIHDKVAPNKPLTDIKETEAHAKVFLEMLNKKEEITNKLLLKWHNEIFKETKQDIAGKFRDYLVKVGQYLALDWQDIENSIKEMILFIKKSKKEKMNPVEVAARVHYKFEKIHPFGDGNGRIGRLLMNHILWHSGYPMLIIECKKRRSYYKALQKDEEGFLKYFLRRYLLFIKKDI